MQNHYLTSTYLAIMNAKVQEYQTIYDIALQYCGSVDAAIDILLLNNKPNEELAAGEELLIPSAFDAQILNWINSNKVSISTAVLPNEFLPSSPPQYVPPCPQVSYLVEYESGVFIASGAVSAGSNIHVVVNVNAPDTGLLPFKTGQTVVYNIGDDGDTQRGQNLGTIPFLNAFANNHRFTALNGSQTFIVPPNAAGCGVDWSTWNGKSGGQVMLFTTGNLSSVANTEYTTVLANIAAFSVVTAIGNVSGFRMVNLTELTRLTRYTSLAFGIAYFPLNGADNLICLTCTQNPQNTAQVMARLTNGSIAGVNITDGGFKRTIGIRYATVNIVGNNVTFTL